jgi:hypothetical protein
LASGASGRADLPRTRRAVTGTALASDEQVFDHGAVARAEELARDPVPGDRADERPHAPGQAASGVTELAERVRPTDLARDRQLPVLAAFDGLLPASGLRRGTTVAVDARPGVAGATSLALAVAAGASQAGSWVAAVGLGSLGLVAASELGVAFERLVLVADPGRERAGWASVVAALVDGFDVVLVAAEGRLRPADARRLVARVRERGAVLVAVGGELPGERSVLRLTVTSSRWEGLGAGWGHLRGRRVTVESGGRGEASRGRRAELWLPGPEGTAAAVEPVAEPIPLRPRRSRRRPPPEPAPGPGVSAGSARQRAPAPTAPSPPQESA